MNTTPPQDQPTCPTTKQLQDWLDGHVDLAPELLAHLRSCPKCLPYLATLSDDPDLQAIANQSLRAPLAKYGSEPERDQLRHLLRNWPLSDQNPPTSHPSDPPQLANTSPQLETHPVATQPTRHATLLESPSHSQTSNDSDRQELRALTVDELNRRLPSGHYRVDRLLAQGGNGAVYLAYDQRLHREVAIKVLGKDSTRDRQRFQREARILAELEHPHVVKVFDFGSLESLSPSSKSPTTFSNTSQLYLVMEYLAGGTSLQLANSPPPNSSPAISNLDASHFPRLARLLATAGEGLTAAHAHGLIHRDIKPNNLLLTADRSMLKVADFGLARFAHSDASLVTRTGDLLGTPAFMSPEQIQSSDEVSPSSDIYSFGATIYQLLTGEPPFRGSSLVILRQITETNPIPPRILNPHIPIDFEIICQKAMEKSPSLRYASIRDLTDDLQRFANGTPILARPTPASTKAWIFLKKNPSFTAAVATCVFLLVLLTAGSLFAALQFRDQNRRLRQSVQSESLAKQAAQSSLQKAMDAADQLLVSVTEDTDLLPRTPGSEEVARKLLLKAQNYYRQVADSGVSETRVAFDEARAHAGLAQVALRLGDPASVETDAKAALDKLLTLPANLVSSTERAILAAKTLSVLGKSLSTRGELERAAKVMTQAVETCEQQLASQHDQPELQFLFADSLRGLAIAENMAGRLDEAEAHLLQAEKILASLLHSDPEHPRYLRCAAGCQSTLAVTLIRRDGYQAAKEHLENAISILSKLEQNGSLPIRLRPDRATNRINLGTIEFHLGNPEKSDVLFQQAEDEYRQLSQLEPNVIDHRYKLVLTILNFGKAKVALDQIEPMLHKYQEVLPILDELLLNDPNSLEYLGTLGMIQGNMAVLLRMLDRPLDALQVLHQSDQTLKRYATLIDQTPDSLHAVAMNHYELSKCFLALQRLEEGLAAILDSMQLTESILQEHHDFLPSQMHQIDELIAKAELLAASPENPLPLLRETIDQGLVRSKALLDQNPDLSEYHVARGLLFSMKSQSLRRENDAPSARDAAEEGLRYLHSLQRERTSADVREAYFANYTALAQSILAIASDSHLTSDPETSTTSDSANRPSAASTAIEQALNDCRTLGATEEELAIITTRLQPPSNQQ